MRTVSEKTQRLIRGLLHEPPIVIYPSLVRALGGVNEALLVGWVMAAEDRSDDGRALLLPDEVWEATGMDSVAQQAPRSTLVALGVWEETETEAGIVVTLNFPTLATLVEHAALSPLRFSPAPLSVNPLLTKRKIDTPPIGSPPRTKEKSTARASVCPDDFAPTDRTVEIVVGYPSITRGDVAIETVKFVNHHQAKGNRFVDWQAAFRKWMLNVSTWRGRDDRTPSEGTTVIRGQMSAERRRDLEVRAAYGDQEAIRALGR